MSSLYYENQGTSTYLVYEIKNTDVIDSMSLGMITNNRIAGLAQSVYTQMDNQMFVKYNVSAKVSVSQFFEGTVNRKRLIGVFNGIVDALISAEEYMIDARSILLNMDYIFTDVSTCETILICLPLEYGMEEVTDLGMFFKGIMFNTQFDQTENSDHVAKIINYLNGTPVFSLYEFKNVLQSINSGAVQSNYMGGQVASGLQQSMSVQSAPPVQSTLPVQSVPPVQSTPPVQSMPPVQSAPPVQSVPPMSSTTSSQVVPTAKPVPPMGGGMPPMSGTSTYQEKKKENPGGMKIPTSSSTPQKVGGMNIPGGNKTVEQEQTPVGTGDKEISWFYLMQHYNKDNAAAYKAQKEAKKEAKKNGGSGKGKKNAKMEMPGQTMPVPGQTMAVLGQAMPEQAAVPNQGANTPTHSALFGNSAIQQPTVQQPVVQQSYVQQTTLQQTYTQPSMTGGFGETTVLSTATIGETTVLSQMQNPMQPATPFLVRVKNNEKVMLSKPTFRIGKERSFVDYFIGDNTAISRCHAQIVNNGNEYYVIDMNSTNHTFVNGIMINSNEQVKLSEGDKVRLANEDFEFHLR